MLPTRLRFFCLFGTVLVAGCASSSPGAAPATPGAVPAASAGGGNRPGEGVLYSPVSGMHYRLDSRDSLSMEMPDGSFQRSVTVKASYLTMTFESTAGGLNATIALDSMTLDRPNSMFQPLVDSTRGTEWRGSLAPTGRFESLEVNHPSLFGAQVRTMMSRLMPMLPAAGAEAGKTWIDSTNVPFSLMAGFEASEHRMAEYRAGRTEDNRGIRSLPIQSTIRYTVSGSGSMMGPEIHMEGTGLATGTHRISLTGRLLEASIIDSVSMTLNVPAAGQTVPAIVIATYSLTSLP